MTLQPLDTSSVDGHPYLSAQPGHVLWGRLPHRGDEPVIAIASGDTIVVDTVSHEGLLPDQGSDPLAYFGGHGVAPDGVLSDAIAIVETVERGPDDGPHIVTGPIAVTGAKPGDVLAVTIAALEQRVPYGVISTRHGKGVLTGTELEGSYGAFCSVVDVEGSTGAGGSRGEQLGSMVVDEASGRVATFALNPFLGIVGVGADAAERPHSVPPGLYGGNIDIRDFTVGTTLFLPVQVDDALLYVGDPHFAQGDGEVALTALEASLRATLTVELLPAAEVGDALTGVSGPFGVAHGRLIATGLDVDLDEALRKAVTNAVALLGNLLGFDPQRAYLYLSAAADFDISQAVDVVKGVHGRIPLAGLGAPLPGALAERLWGGA